MAKTDKPERTLYFVEEDAKSGSYFRESEPALMSRSRIVEMVRTGEIENPISIIEVTIGEPAREVLEDIIREVCDRLVDNGPDLNGNIVPDYLIDLIEDVIGVKTVDRIEASAW